MTYAFTKYWIEGDQEALQILFEAIKNGEGWAVKSLENLGVDTEDYDTHRVEWCNPELLEKDGQQVLYFEEYHGYMRGTLIDQLLEEKMFAGKFTHRYFYVEEPACADIYETNDLEGKYWPYRLCILAEFPGEEEQQWLYFKDEAEAVAQLQEKYGVPGDLNDLEAIKAWVDGQSEEEEAFWVMKISVV